MDKIQDYEVNSPRWLSLEDFEGEEWKDFPEFEEYYMISNLGRAKSKDRSVYLGGKRNCRKRVKGIVLHVNTSRVYYAYHICKDGESYARSAHRAVAKAFVPNPTNLPIVNHKDENKLNNCFWNLEWCTDLYNVRYGSRIYRQILSSRNKQNPKSVEQYDLNGNFIKCYPSTCEAARQTSLERANISSCCRHVVTSVKGFIFRFSDDKEWNIEKCVEAYRSRLHPKINQFTLDGKYIRSYSSYKEAANAVSVCDSSIRQCLRNPSKHTSGGYRWSLTDSPFTNQEPNDIYKKNRIRKVSCKSIDGKTSLVFNSQSEAARHFGVCPSIISNCCNGKKGSYKGYVFSFFR